MSRSALVTGAGGFAGSHIAAGLLRAGLAVIGVDRRFDAAARTRLAGARLVEAELAAEALAGLRADLVVHAAAVTTPETPMPPAAFLAANLRPLVALVEALEGIGADAAIFLSSSGVFGPRDGGAELRDSDAATGPGPYAAAKRAGEALWPASGVAAPHVVRLGHLFGPGEVARPTRARTSPVARWCASAAAGQAPQVPANDPVRDWTWAPDLGPALLALAAAPARPGPVHLGSGAVRADSAIAGRIAAAAGLGLRRGPAEPTKPPMRPSDLPALARLTWTSPEDGVDALLAESAPA